jgi:hypothetical protein
VRFKFVVEVEVKDNGLARDAGELALATILSERLVRAVGDLPWVLQTSVTEGRRYGESQ